MKILCPVIPKRIILEIPELFNISTHVTQCLVHVTCLPMYFKGKPSCADQESFVRGGRTLKMLFFLFS